MAFKNGRHFPRTLVVTLNYLATDLIFSITTEI